MATLVAVPPGSLIESGHRFESQIGSHPQRGLFHDVKKATPAPLTVPAKVTRNDEFLSVTCEHIKAVENVCSVFVTKMNLQTVAGWSAVRLESGGSVLVETSETNRKRELQSRSRRPEIGTWAVLLFNPCWRPRGRLPSVNS